MPQKILVLKDIFLLFSFFKFLFLLLDTLALLFCRLFTAVLHYFKNTHFQNHKKVQEKFSSSLSEGLSRQYTTNNKFTFTTYNEPDTIIKSAFTREFTLHHSHLSQR